MQREGKKPQLSFHLPQSPGSGESNKWIFEEKLKHNLESCKSHIFHSSAGHSATFPKTAGVLKGYPQESIIPRQFGSSKHCITGLVKVPCSQTAEHYLGSSQWHSVFSKVSQNVSIQIQALVYLENRFSTLKSWLWKSIFLYPCPREKQVGGRFAFVTLDGGERTKGEMRIIGEKTIA